MNEHDVLKKNRNFYIGVGGTVLEGLLSGSLFMLLYSVMQFLWSGQFDMNRVLALTGIIAVVFLLRILIYSYGYTKAQIGGAEVSKNIRLFMGDHLKRIPLSRFTQGQTGDYINTITSDVNNYEKILTHAMLRRLERKTGIKASPHMLRHYFANARRKDGWKLEMISQALGHRNIETTMKYLNITEDELIEVSDAFYNRHQAMYGVQNLL